MACIVLVIALGINGGLAGESVEGSCAVSKSLLQQAAVPSQVSLSEKESSSEESFEGSFSCDWNSDPNKESCLPKSYEIKGAKECKSNDFLVDKKTRNHWDNCGLDCLDRPGCSFFNYATYEVARGGLFGSNRFQCWLEMTAASSSTHEKCKEDGNSDCCPEGFKTNNYNYYWLNRPPTTVFEPGYLWSNNKQCGLRLDNSLLGRDSIEDAYWDCSKHADKVYLRHTEAYTYFLVVDEHGHFCQLAWDPGADTNEDYIDAKWLCRDSVWASAWIELKDGYIYRGGGDYRTRYYLTWKTHSSGDQSVGARWRSSKVLDHGDKMEFQPEPAMVTGLHITENENCASWTNWEYVHHQSSLSPDLNKNAGGKYINLCVERDPNKAPITSIQIQKSSSCPSGYHRISQQSSLNGDLNQGAGGDDIFMCYSTEKGRDSFGIVRLELRESSSCQNGPKGLKQVRKHEAHGDLNKGAGGKDIYLCYSDGQ
eukprot:TRINITY_DN87193_c0_g1_i1.p1 TRINITY_DN87193_c0_g1~~TRINITY_DN87193_c0_g1_i1.p1  ORF type:complete len:482 (-),score=76.33 TRINITY_DN87193_c0_g1_i1:202-1647(-)